MALIFADGFDKYGVTADLSNTYPVISGESLSTSGGVTGGGSLSMLSTGSFSISLVSATEFIIVCHFKFLDTAWPAATQFFFYFKDSSGTVGPGIGITNTGNLVARRGATILETSSQTITRDVYHSLEMRVLNDNVIGRIEVNLDGEVWLDFTGDTQIDTDTLLNSFLLSHNSTIPDLFLDDLIIMNTTGTSNNSLPGYPILIETLRPDGDGTTNNWTPTGAGTTNSDRVDDDPGPDGDTTYVSSGTITDKDLYTFGNIVTAGAISFDGVQVSNIARKETAGARNINNTIKSGATESDGSSEALTTLYLTYSTLYDVDPNTSVAWLEANINALEGGVEVNS